MVRWPPPRYQIHVEFRAPRKFVYRWCTDYRHDDGHFTKETYDRRILERSKEKVVYEDLWWEPDGWRWRRNVVTLDPPHGWRADSIGNVRTARIDYRLLELGGDRTRLALSMRRCPGLRQRSQPSKVELERELLQMWQRYARALEADYRRSIGTKRRARRSSTR
ncbi:MAG: hypothetical protein HKL79_02495 [Thermoplasmata archaeon]|nr:hypothetical protein [Thermoplasmata archaeon]